MTRAYRSKRPHPQPGREMAGQGQLALLITTDDGGGGGGGDDDDDSNNKQDDSVSYLAKLMA